MSLKTMLSNVKKANAAHKKALRDLGKNIGKEIAAALGPLIPEGYALEWTQYTPYFNDGEACEFSVNAPCLIPLVDPEGNKLGIGDRYEGDDGVVCLPYDDPNEFVSKKAMTQLDKSFSAITEEVMLAAFGDHAIVRITRAGKLETSDHSHD